MRRDAALCLRAARAQVALMSVILALAAGSGMALSSVASAETCPNATARSGPSEELPDCRAYEQVSPVEKNGADAVPMGLFSFPARASVPPEGSSRQSSIEYMSVGSFEGSSGDLGGALLPNAYVSSLQDGVWRTHRLTPPTPQAPPTGVIPLGYDFSEDLSRVVIKLPVQQLTPDAPAGVYNLYLREPDGSFSLITDAPPSVSLPTGCELCFQAIDLPAFAGASSDYGHVFFEVNESLTPGAPGGGVSNLYENLGGQLRLVGILPDGSIAPEGSVPGSGLSSFYSAVFTAAAQRIDHAISSDGSHAVFQATADGGAPAPAQAGLTEVYDRIDGSSTIELSAPAAGATPSNPQPEPAQFWAASEDGLRVFFTSSAELTTESNTGVANAGQDLYESRTDTGELTDLTVDRNPVDAATGAGVQGVLGSSTDGSYVYFVATGQLISERGLAGQPNLYVAHGGHLDFIATLGEADARDWTSSFAELRSYVTPDGRHLAFMSTRSLTGYDNTDQGTGEPDSEVYLYGVGPASGPICVSCDPGGERPTANAFIGARADQQVNTAFHLARTLSDDGSRLFFTTAAQIGSGAASRYTKVYQYENGAVQLLSSGTNGSSDAIFLDASPSGDDVFFATRDQMVSADRDSLLDVYDARAGGSSAPEAPVSACSGSVCLQPPLSATPLLSPLSMSFVGLENPVPRTGSAKAKVSNKAHKAKKSKRKKPKHKHTSKKSKSKSKRAKHRPKTK